MELTTRTGGLASYLYSRSATLQSIIKMSMKGYRNSLLQTRNPTVVRDPLSGQRHALDGGESGALELFLATTGTFPM